MTDKSHTTAWRPIETAPKDGSYLLMTNGYHSCEGPYGIGGWIGVGYWTHCLRGNGNGLAQRSGHPQYHSEVLDAATGAARI